MRTLNSALVIALIGTAAVTTHVQASPYPAAEGTCQSAISTRLGLEAVPSQYTLAKVHNTMHYRDFSYVVSADQPASTVQDVKVTCRVRKTGDLMALTFDPAATPVSVAKTQ